MISHKHKFIFIHIPKCGGTSIERALLREHGLAGSLTKDQKKEFGLYYAHNGIHVQHQKIDEYDDIYEKKYFTFAFVRNPWEKLLSEYFYILENKSNSDFYSKFPSFKHFVLHDGIEERFYRNYAHDIPQIDFILNIKKNKLTNFVGRLESLQQDFDFVCDRIGIPRQQLPHKNKSKHKHYTEYYDEETKSIVAEKYAKDIEYFGYEFGE
jgi:hypothetical protein